MDKQYTEYDKKDIYDEKIAPLVAEMRRTCKLNKIPFFITTAVSNKKGVTKYCNDGVMPGSNSIELHEDRFRKYLLVLQGAEVSILPNEDETIADYIASNETEDDFE